MTRLILAPGWPLVPSREKFRPRSLSQCVLSIGMRQSRKFSTYNRRHFFGLSVQLDTWRNSGQSSHNLKEHVKQIWVKIYNTSDQFWPSLNLHLQSIEPYVAYSEGWKILKQDAMQHTARYFNLSGNSEEEKCQHKARCQHTTYEQNAQWTVNSADVNYWQIFKATYYRN